MSGDRHTTSNTAYENGINSLVLFFSKFWWYFVYSRNFFLPIGKKLEWTRLIKKS